jgi:hypothetical protein
MLDRKYRGILQGTLLLLILAFAAWKFAFPGVGQGPRIDCNWTERLPVAQLEYSSHARCRMGCRNIDQRMVEAIYLHGQLNCKKNSVVDGHPRYALEKRDDRGDLLRVIVADDGDRHVIVTVIRLDHEDRCSCS